MNMSERNTENAIHWIGFWGVIILVIFLFSQIGSCTREDRKLQYTQTCINKNGQIEIDGTNYVCHLPTEKVNNEKGS